MTDLRPRQRIARRFSDAGCDAIHYAVTDLGTRRIRRNPVQRDRISRQLERTSLDEFEVFGRDQEEAAVVPGYAEPAVGGTLSAVRGAYVVSVTGIPADVAAELAR